MKRMISTTAVLSIALSTIQPLPLLAQEAACAADDAACLAAEDTSAAPEVVEAEVAPVATPEPEPAPEAAAAEPTPAAEPEPVESAEAEPVIEPEAAPAEAPALEAQPVPEAEVAVEPAEQPVVADPTPTETQAPVETIPEPTVEPSAPETPAEPEAEVELQVEVTEPTPAANAVAEPPVDTVEAIEPAPSQTPEPTEPAPPPTPEELAEMQAVEEAAQEAARQAEELAKAAIEAPAEPVLAPEVTLQEAKQLESLIESAEDTAPIAAAVADEKPAVQVVETVITPMDARSSAQEFSSAPVAVGQGKKSGLSDLEKAGLLALGALALGTMMSNGNEVVSNSGDRVVVRDDQGGYQIYKDDDTLLRRPGSNVRSEQFSDGSSRTIVDRDDGVRVITLRDASGRVLRRSQIDRFGQEHVLIDDLRRHEQVDISRLPRPQMRPPTKFVDQDAALVAALAREEARELGRSYSLRQIRDIPALRQLAVTIDVDNITFASGSAVIRPSEAAKLSSLGRIMQRMLAANPAEVFLVEGHTDAVGSEASNLTLSDRRAESVALALTEYYRIPPENMVVQGYGEAELRISTQANEPRNRRAAVRLITPLMEAHN